MASKLSKFEKALATLHYREGQRLAEKSEEEARRLLGQTFSQPITGFIYATVKSRKEVTQTKNGCIVKMHFFVASSVSGLPHKVWHIVNRGRKGGRIKNNVAFRPRRGRRTRPRSLHVRQFQGFEADKVFLPKGTYVRGIEPRNFYETALNKLLFNLFRSGRYKKWKIMDKEVNNDD